ncbi:MAG: hypothetical protein ACOC1R_00280, partial [Tangfeifania sp.]
GTRLIAVFYTGTIIGTLLTAVFFMRTTIGAISISVFFYANNCRDDFDWGFLAADDNLRDTTWSGIGARI